MGLRVNESGPRPKERARAAHSVWKSELLLLATRLWLAQGYHNLKLIPESKCGRLTIHIQAGQEPTVQISFGV